MATQSQPTQSHLATTSSILVAGAGISGLSFAISLLQYYPVDAAAKPHITILERDSHASRLGREGYTLTLRTDSRSGGVQVLDRLGLYEGIKAASVSGGAGEGREGTMFIWDRHWKELMSVRSEGVKVGGKELKAMRIRRNALQRVLAEEAERRGAAIRWGVEVVDVVVEKERVMVTLSDGSSETCDLLVAADGSKSKIRGKLRPEDKLDFAGVVCISGTARYESQELVPKPLDRDWGLVLGGGGTGLFLAPVDERSALWSLSYYAKEPRQQMRHPIPDEQVKALLSEGRTLGKVFGSKLNDLVDNTDPSTLMVFNAMDRPPFQHTPGKDGPIIWIGDSNHAVSPFAGNGANMALVDGWDLATCLVQGQSLEEVIAAYDKLFVPRSKATLKMSRWSIDIAHSTGLKLWLYTLLTKILRFFFVKGKA
jgi:2-polyprenyl-6-methoxyphenol hydroxylase-like FAD-dependent oxidoreductase